MSFSYHKEYVLKVVLGVVSQNIVLSLLSVAHLQRVQVYRSICSNFIVTPHNLHCCTYVTIKLSWKDQQYCLSMGEIPISSHNYYSTCMHLSIVWTQFFYHLRAVVSNNCSELWTTWSCLPFFQERQLKLITIYISFA